MPLIKEDHSVSYSSLAGAGYKHSNQAVISPMVASDVDNDNDNDTLNNKSSDDSFIGVNGMNSKDLVSSTSTALNNTPIIVPGAEWKCNRCNRFNDSDYQFCGYCSHKRLSIVEEAAYEPSNSDLAFQNSPVDIYANKSPLSPVIQSPQPGSAPKDDNPQSKVVVLEKWHELGPSIMDNDRNKKKPSKPSMNAPRPTPMQKPTFSSKKSNKSSIASSISPKKKKRHFYNISDSSVFGDNNDNNGNKYEYMGINSRKHNPKQSSILSSVFGDTEDIDSDDSIVISSDEDGSSSATNTVNNDDRDRFKKHDIVKSGRIMKRTHTNTRTTDPSNKKPWSMSSASPTLSAVSHTTNTSFQTNLDTDLNATTTVSSGLSAKLRGKIGPIGDKHGAQHSNLSDFTDIDQHEHSQIGDINNKISILHGRDGGSTPISPARPIPYLHDKHQYQKSSSFMNTPNRMKHIRGMSSMSSMMNYNTENESFFMTDMETSIDIENDALRPPYDSDPERENKNEPEQEQKQITSDHISQASSSIIDPFGQVITEELDLPQLDENRTNQTEEYSTMSAFSNDTANLHRDRHTSISRRASHQDLMAKKDKFALPAKYDETLKQRETDEKCETVRTDDKSGDEDPETKQEEAEASLLHMIDTNDGDITPLSFVPGRPTKQKRSTEKRKSDVKIKKKQQLQQKSSDHDIITQGQGGKPPKQKSNDSLDRMVVQVKYINEVRQELIRRTYKFPHNTKFWIAVIMWIYIIAGFGATIYLGTHFNCKEIAVADDTELLSYECPNKLDMPFEVQLSYQISDNYAVNYSRPVTYFGEDEMISSMTEIAGFESEEVSNSARWAIAVILAILMYILIWLPLVLLIATIFMIYNVYRGRTFDINTSNICYGFLYHDILCCCGKCPILQKWRKHESDVAKYGKKTMKNKRNSGHHKSAKFHGISQHDEDEIAAPNIISMKRRKSSSDTDHLELEIQELNVMDSLQNDDDRMQTPTRERLHSFSGDINNDDEKDEIVIYKHSSGSSSLESDSDDNDGLQQEYIKSLSNFPRKSSIPDSFTEYAFLCNDKIFVNPTKEDEKRLEFMKCDNSTNGTPSKALTLRPSSVQQKFVIQKQNSPKKKRKKRKKKSKKKKRKRNNR